MLLHAVLFNFKPDLSEEKKKRIYQLSYEKLEPIPGVMNLHTGKTINESAEYEHGVFMYFEDREALQKYRAHPEHIRFRDEEFFPFLESYTGLDYED